MGHGAMGMDDDEADAKKELTLDDAEREKAWLKELAEDPYIGESRRILGDMAMPLKGNPGGAALADQNSGKNSVYSRP